MECHGDLRNVQDLLADGKTPCEWRFGEPFERPMIPIGARVEYYPISARDQSGLHQIGKNVLPRNFHRICMNCGENLERRSSGLQTLKKLEKMDALEICPRGKCKRSFNAAKERIIHIPSCRWHSETFWKRCGVEIPL